MPDQLSVPRVWVWKDAYNATDFPRINVARLIVSWVLGMLSEHDKRIGRQALSVPYWIAAVARKCHASPTKKGGWLTEGAPDDTSSASNGTADDTGSPTDSSNNPTVLSVGRYVANGSNKYDALFRQRARGHAEEREKLTFQWSSAEPESITTGEAPAGLRSARVATIPSRHRFHVSSNRTVRFHRQRLLLLLKPPRDVSSCDGGALSPRLTGFRILPRSRTLGAGAQRRDKLAS